MNGLILIRKNFGRLLYLFDLLLGNKPKVFVLSYHSISSDWHYGVSLSNFKKQISYLKAHFNFITPTEFEDYLYSNKNLIFPSVLLTFDDGYEDVLKVKAFLKNKHIIPLMFLLSEPKNANRQELATQKKLLTLRQILSLKKMGWEFGSHGATHSDFWTLSPDQIKNEVITSKKVLTQNFGQIKYFAYPKGRFTPTAIKAISKAGYNLAFSMNDGFIDPTINKLFIPRIGINQTHDFGEFVALFSPTVVQFRRMCKIFKLEKAFI